jgi:hypothetical protein
MGGLGPGNDRDTLERNRQETNAFNRRRDAEFNEKMRSGSKPVAEGEEFEKGVDGFAYLLALVLVGVVIWNHAGLSFLTNVILVVAAVLLVVHKVTRYITLFVGTIAGCVWLVIHLWPVVFK